MPSPQVLVALVSASLVSFSDANDFLQARADDKYISKEDVEETLLSEISKLSSSTKLRSIEEELRPMFVALPKNKHGSLEPSGVRYALHRFFVQKHGWYMMGLDPAGQSLNASAPATLVKDRAPAFIQGLFEQRMHGEGLGLEELAVFAAVMSDLVHKEALQGLQKAYASLRLPTVGPVPKRWSDQAIKAYLIQYLIGGNLTITGMEDFEFLERELPEIYPDWEGTWMWVEDLHEANSLMLQPRRNPFVPHRETYDSSYDFVQELGHHFGAFQDLECKALKGRLVEMELQGTGRIRLSRFYEGAVKGDWTLSESVAYLRNLGVLDETDPNKPSVVIANYMTSSTNCLSTSGFYSVCCMDECEGLMQHLERDIAAPSAVPSQIVESVSALHSDTVDAPRNLSASLVGRLHEIAEVHSGRVPLHGRLFAQWMHHAYPRECPFPHVSGTTSPMSPDDWMEHHGIDNIEATMEEMKAHHARLEQEAVHEEEVALPWTHVEELVAGHHEMHSVPRGSWTTSVLRGIMALAAVASFAVPLLKASRNLVSGSDTGKAESCLV